MSNAQAIAIVVSNLSILRGTLFTLSQVKNIVNGAEIVMTRADALVAMCSSLDGCIDALIDIFPDVGVEGTHGD